jgi:hypothetical protein
VPVRNWARFAPMARRRAAHAAWFPDKNVCTSGPADIRGVPDAASRPRVGQRAGGGVGGRAPRRQISTFLSPFTREYDNSGSSTVRVTAAPIRRFHRDYRGRAGPAAHHAALAATLLPHRARAQ